MTEKLKNSPVTPPEHKVNDPRAKVPKVALPPHMKNYRSSHIAGAGIRPLGQVIKPTDPHYAGKTKTKTKIIIETEADTPPLSSSRPTALNKKVLGRKLVK